MKSIKKSVLFFMAVISLSIICTQPAFSQEKSALPNVKSLIVMEERHEDGSVTTYKESETKYDSRGNIIEILEYKDGKIDTHFKYEYDENNNKIRETEFTKKGEVDKISEYKYKNGLRIEKLVYDAQKNLILKKTY